MVVKNNPAVLLAGSTEIVWWHIGISHPPFKNPGCAPEVDMFFQSVVL